MQDDETAIVEDFVAVATLYSTAALEELGLFAVTDRLVELWLQGGLPVRAGGAASALDAYWLGRAERPSDELRGELYSRLFGPGNPAFDGLWSRLLAALLEPSDRAVATAAAELRANLLEHSRAAAAPAVARGLHQLLERVQAILSDPEVLSVYGARDFWQLVDRLARLELGRIVDVDRARTLAASGVAILGWLAEPDPVVLDDVVDAARSWLAANSDARGL